MLLPELKDKLMKLALEAGNWSSHHLNLNDLGSSLRSSDLNPESEVWNYVTEDRQVQKIVSQLCDKRRELLASESINLKNKLQGRVLCFYPEISLKDAVVCLASSGFIDQDDSPPWDTWIWYSLDDIEQHHEEKYACLFSWVPDELVSLIDKAIEEDTYDCLIWAEKLEKELGIN